MKTITSIFLIVSLVCTVFAKKPHHIVDVLATDANDGLVGLYELDASQLSDGTTALVRGSVTTNDGFGGTYTLESGEWVLRDRNLDVIFQRSDDGTGTSLSFTPPVSGDYVIENSTDLINWVESPPISKSYNSDGSVIATINPLGASGFFRARATILSVLERITSVEDSALTVDNIDEAILPYNGSRIYLDPVHGSDVLGSIDAPMRPFKTWEAATASVPEGGVIVCAAGTIEITNQINRDDVSIYAPQTSFVRGAGFNDFLFSVKDSGSGDKFIIADTITGQNLFRCSNRLLKVIANKITVIDEGLLEDDGITLKPIAICSNFQFLGFSEPKFHFIVDTWESNLLGASASNPMQVFDRVDNTTRPMDIIFEGRNMKNMMLTPSPAPDIRVTVNLTGSWINDATGFTGGIFGFENTDVSDKFDAINYTLRVAGDVKSLNGAGFATIKFNEGEHRFEVGGGIYSLDSQPAIEIVKSNAETNGFGSSSSYFKTPIASSLGSPLKLSLANRDVVFDGVHFTSDDVTALLLDGIAPASSGGNKVSEVWFRNCSTDLDGNSNYVTTGGEVDLNSIEDQTTMTATQKTLLELFGVIIYQTEATEDFLSQFKF